MIVPMSYSLLYRNTLRRSLNVGLAFASVSPRAWLRAEHSTLPRYYLDWRLTADSQAKNNTAFTLGNFSSASAIGNHKLAGVFGNHKTKVNSVG